MVFHWRADDGPLIVVFGSPSPHQLQKTAVKAGPLCQNFLGPRMPLIMREPASSCVLDFVLFIRFFLWVLRVDL